VGVPFEKQVPVAVVCLEYSWPPVSGVEAIEEAEVMEPGEALA
jgi:hypothetical protein